MNPDLGGDGLTDRAARPGREWLVALGALLNGVPGVACPICASPDLQYRFVGEVGTRIGFVAVWSELCGRGFWFSRARAPADAPFCSFEEAARLGLPPDAVLA